jgi:ankyrin repeat protein
MSNEFDCEYLFRIVHLGDSQEFLENLEGNSALNINIQNEAGESLLIHCVKRLEAKWTAVFGGEFRTICKMLIDRNIDVNLRDASGKTAANYAAEYQQLEVLRLLVQKGAHLDRNVLDSVIDKEDWILALCASLAKESGLEHESEDTSGQASIGVHYNEHI